MDSRIWIIESHRIQTGPKRCPSRPGQAAPARSRHSNAVKSPAGIEYSVVRTSIWSRVTVTPFGLCKCGRTPRGSCQGWPHVPARPKSWRGRRASSVCVCGGGGVRWWPPPARTDSAFVALHLARGRLAVTVRRANATVRCWTAGPGPGPVPRQRSSGERDQGIQKQSGRSVLTPTACVPLLRSIFLSTEYCSTLRRWLLIAWQQLNNWSEKLYLQK
jgi:hypothetical protein